MAKEIKKILAVRFDRLGDAVLTLPAISALRERFPSAGIFFLVKEKIAPLFENNPDIDGILAVPESESAGSIAKKLKKFDFDVSIHFFVDGKTPLAAWLARIPLRVGPLSKISSVFLNRRLRQGRKKSLKHEADYNLELASALGCIPHPRPAALYLTEEEKQKFPRGEKVPLVGIHPGGAARGRPLPPANFRQLGEFLRRAARVQVSIGPEDRFLRPIFGGFEIVENLSLRDFAAWIDSLDLFISNSTGPLHIATALAVSTVSFFGKEKTISPTRWGPYPKSEKNLVYFCDEFDSEKVLAQIERNFGIAP